MRVLSINVGRVREVPHEGRVVRTAIFKQPVKGLVRVSRLGIEGDEQADRRYHGGPEMAVYAYASSGYDYWRREMPEADLPYGKFGENLTIEGLDDDSVHIGDVFRIGPEGRGVVVQPSVPRAPCSKLGLTMGSPQFVKVFLKALKLGWYLRVMEEGEIQVGDEVVRLNDDPARLSITEVSRLRFFEQENVEGAKRAAGVATLTPEWVKMFEERVGKAE